MGISDHEIWACAHELIRQHGADAAIHTAMRADELLFDGQLDGAAVMNRILRCINQLQASTTIQ